MTRFLLRRLASMILTLLAVTLIVFLLLEVDGTGIAVRVLGPYAAADQLQQWLQANGYDRPVMIRYLDWLWNVARGEFGESLRFKTPVSDIVAVRLWNTAILGFWAMLIYVAIGIVLGIVAGIAAGSKTDRTVSLVAIVTASVPEFASAALLTFVFVYWLHWLPGTSGMSGGWDGSQLVLPATVLVLYGFGYIARMTRASTVVVMEEPYIRTAVLKGIPFRQVILRHVLRNALIVPFTVIMLQINWLLAGVIVVEAFFAYKGFGALLLDAALNKDVFLLQGCTMVAVVVAVTTQFVADLGYMLLNPRIRFQ